MARRILNNKISSMITYDPKSRMFWCFNYARNSYCRAYKIALKTIISLKTSDALRAPIHIFVQVSFLFTPQN